MVIDEKLYNEIKEITSTDYEGWLDKEKEQVFVTSDNIEGMLEDLICEIQHIQEEFEDYKEFVNENYKQIPYERQI